MHRPRMTCWAVSLLVASIVAAPAVAQDSESSEKAERARKAKKAFDEGMEHYVEENYAKAIVDFKRAQNLYPSAMLWYNIALARMHQGNEEKAMEAAEEALAFDGEPLPDKSRAKAQAVLAGSSVVLSSKTWTADRAKAIAEAEEAEREKRENEKKEQKQVEASRQNETAEPSTSASGPVDTGPAMGAVGWTGAVAGVLGVGGLVGVPILAGKYDSEVEELERLSTGPSRQAFVDQKSQVESTRQTGRLLLYTGSALTAVGAGLVALDLFVLEPGGEGTQRVSAGIGARGQLRLDVHW